MATKKSKTKKEKKVVINKEDIVMLSNKELVDILKEEMSPAAKMLKVGMILAGGVNLNIYTVGYRLKMHPAEIHHALVELRHRNVLEAGGSRDTVTVRR